MDLYYEDASAVMFGIATEEGEDDPLSSGTVSITCNLIVPDSLL